MLKTALRLCIVLIIIGIYGIAVPALISSKSDLNFLIGLLVGVLAPIPTYYLLRALAKG